MRIVKHNYNPSLDWKEVVAESMGGNIDGRFIKGNNLLYKGIHYVRQVDSDILVMVLDTLYKDDVLIKYYCTDTNAVGMYFYITNNDIEFKSDLDTNTIGKLNFNLSILDLDIESEYLVQKGSTIYAICIFIKKDTLNNMFYKIPEIKYGEEVLFNKKRNAIIHMGRMSHTSRTLINDFKKVPYDHSFFDIYLNGLVYGLINDYLENVTKKKDTIIEFEEDDLKKILSSKIYLLNAIEGNFPGIELLAMQAGMSQSKYKKLFLKVTEQTPGFFFSLNKLQYAKQLLESRNYKINEVCEKLNYKSISYFSRKFKEVYGIFPKEYQYFL